MKLVSRLLPTAVAAMLFLGSGCAKRDADPHGAAGGHAHTAPHGGMLIPLGDHAYNLELVRDAAAGKLTLYILDGHAENFIRIQAPVLEGIATVGGEKRPLAFQAVASTATGETVGNTSQFDASAEWLKLTPAFDLAFPRLELRGTVFENVGQKVTTGQRL